ncbi:MAG: ATP-binding protein [Tannerellaceae bacterium]|nr:ATP-binding protein [Tannerellaceae bacterium]
MGQKRTFIVIVFFVAGLLAGGAFLLYPEGSFPFWLMQTMAITTILFSIFLYKTLIYPFELLKNGIQLLKEQDFSTYLYPVKNREANLIIELFNKMITHLRNERLAVREKNHFLDLLIEASPQGIIILDMDKRIADINPAGLRILRIAHLSDVKGKKLDQANFDLAPLLANLRQKEDTILRGKGFSAYRCIRSSFIDKGFDHHFILIEELTNELRKIEKESYERIIRMMSHEVNNSIGAISSTLNVVSDIFTQEDEEEWREVLPAVNASFERCNHLVQFTHNLAHIVRIPAPSVAPVSLHELISSVNALVRIECQQRDIRLTLSLAKENPVVQIDRIQFEQVLVNIIKNAYESIDRQGEIRIQTSSSPLSLIIADNGPGIPSEIQEKIFTPFFTTKTSGQGIGLLFIREVLSNHNCSFNLATQNKWTRFTILF